MYYWRRLTPEQRIEVMRHRMVQHLPWHRPPHFEHEGPNTFIITAACFEHVPIIGKNPERLIDFEKALVGGCAKHGDVYAWCVLPNHYHVLTRTEEIELLRKELGQLHGRTSFLWNREDNTVGRQSWYNYFDRKMRSDRHYWASVNYVNNNAVHHGYVNKWQDWPYSSAHKYLEEVGRVEAERIWREYPVLDYGEGWDVY